MRASPPAASIPAATLVAALLATAVVAPPAHAAPSGPLGEAAVLFEGGEYDRVVELLRAPIEGGEPRDAVERAQALRLYGIACVLTARPQAAEDAFLRWLRLEPRAWLDSTLVRPEVVEFFNGVRVRHRQELLREVERRRPRTAVLNLTPPAGQFQNKQHAKFGVLLGTEVLLGALSLTSYLVLKSEQRDDKTFPDNDLAQRLVAVNWISTVALIAVVVYGIVDGFLYYQRINRELEIDAAVLRAGADSPRGGPERARRTASASRPRFGFVPGGLGFVF